MLQAFTFIHSVNDFTNNFPIFEDFCTAFCTGDLNFPFDRTWFLLNVASLVILNGALVFPFCIQLLKILMNIFNNFFSLIQACAKHENKVLIAWYAIAIYGICSDFLLSTSICLQSLHIYISKYPLQNLLSNGKCFMCISLKTKQIFNVLNPQNQSKQTIVVSKRVHGIIKPVYKNKEFYLAKVCLVHAWFVTSSIGLYNNKLLVVKIMVLRQVVAK